MKLINFIGITEWFIQVANKVCFPGGASGKESACQCRRHEMTVPSLDWEDHLEKEMATHCSIIVWKTHGQRSLVDYIQSLGSQRVGHN